MVQIQPGNNSKIAERDPLVRMAKLGKSDASSASKRALCCLAILIVMLGAVLFGSTSQSKEQDIMAVANGGSGTQIKQHDVVTAPSSAEDNDDAVATDDIERSTSPQDDQVNEEAATDDDDDDDDAAATDDSNDDNVDDDDANGAAGPAANDDDDDDDDDNDDDNNTNTGNDDDDDADNEGTSETETDGDDDNNQPEEHADNVDEQDAEEGHPVNEPWILPGKPEDWSWIIDHEHTPALRIQDFSPPQLLEQFYQARRAMYDQLARDYGPDTFRTMFMRDNDVSVGRTALKSPHSKSRDRVIRKLVMKILQGQLQTAQQQRERRRRRRHVRDRRLQENDGNDNENLPLMIPFVWATGGHSSAAGHGNYYNQSYTAQLERIGQQVFGVAGMHLVGRNFAMGGTSSGMEVGACVDQIFGLDIDVLSWDFGMTDGRGVGIFENYFSHGAIHPNRPAMVGLNLGGDGRSDKIGQLEENGLPVMYMSESEADNVFDAVPDTLGLNQQEIDSLPPFVAYFKCDGKLESGEPGCTDFKFTPDHCPERKFRTSWHQGWRWHGTYGNMIALSLTDMLEDALKYLVEKESYTAQELLDQLRNDENEEYRRFFESDILDPGKTDIIAETDQHGLDMRMVLRTRPICRTCRLPAASRYLGLMTETPVGDMLHYPLGISIQEATSHANDRAEMRLVWEAKERQECEVPLNQDYKDYYIVTPQDDWQSVTVPNDREANYYGTGEPYKGLVMITMPACDWGKCPTGDIREDGYASGKLEMEVNGVRVTGATVGWGSHFLRHGEGELFFPPNEHGRFEIRVKVNGEGSDFTRFSAFTIW